MRLARSSLKFGRSSPKFGRSSPRASGQPRAAPNPKGVQPRTTPNGKGEQPGATPNFKGKQPRAAPRSPRLSRPSSTTQSISYGPHLNHVSMYIEFIYVDIGQTCRYIEPISMYIKSKSSYNDLKSIYVRFISVPL